MIAKHLPLAAVALLAATTALPAAAQVRLFEHAEFQGRSFSADRDVRDLERQGFNDLASSAVVRGGRWVVCTDARFGGTCVTLRPGRYRNFESMGINDQVSSVRRLDGR